MTDRLKDFIARHVFHPLQGMTLGEWWALLRRHRFAIDLRHSPRALVQTAASVSNSAGARLERQRFGRRIDATPVQAPLFILGHYRSGTTHLHNLLALDPQFAAPTFFQVLNPHTFLTTERFASPIVDRLIVRRRYQDEMALGAGVPSEDEFAVCAMTGLSPYLAWCFPCDGAGYDRYLTFREPTDGEIARWGAALTTFLKKLTLRHGRPLVLKSPPHTARIRLLLGLFPDARFVHIRRDPYVVFRSTRHMIRAAPAPPLGLLLPRIDRRLSLGVPLLVRGHRNDFVADHAVLDEERQFGLHQERLIEPVGVPESRPVGCPDHHPHYFRSFLKSTSRAVST